MLSVSSSSSSGAAVVLDTSSAFWEEGGEGQRSLWSNSFGNIYGRRKCTPAYDELYRSI